MSRENDNVLLFKRGRRVARMAAGSSEGGLRQTQSALLFRRAKSPLRRRRGAHIRHLRRHPVVRIGRSFLTALLIVGTPVAVVIWIGHSSLFALQELTVETDGPRVDRLWVEQALQPYYGENLPRLPLAWVDETLRTHPWVASADVHKALPGRLAVRLAEKRAVALLRQGGEIFYLDAEGETIAPLEISAEIAHLFLVTADGEVSPKRALAMAHEIADASPSWAAGLSEIEVLGQNDFRVWSADLAFPLLVRSGTLAAKASYLEAILPQVVRRYRGVEAVDLRFARRIIVQPRGIDG
jgi:cell division septal protein FtsQ